MLAQVRLLEQTATQIELRFPEKRSENLNFQCGFRNINYFCSWNFIHSSGKF